MVRFSVDTLRFDTVFTEVGSSTRFLKVFNDFDESILLSRLSVQEDPNNFFNLNVDGVSAEAFTDVEILPNDSIWVFVEALIDPDNPLSISPFVIESQLQIEVNGNTQRAVIEAWGQNANYIPEFRKDQGNGVFRLDCPNSNIIWDDPKPYVIYGILLIDECTLTIPPGTQIYVHGGVVSEDDNIFNDGLIWTSNTGKIISNGTLEEPVIIQGDRLEENFADVLGQWAGIRFLAGSKGNIFRHTIVKNSIVGMRVDSASSLSLESCKIFNTSSSGLIGFHSEIDMMNTLIHSNGGNSFQIVYGGNYSVQSSTLANYGNNSEALAALNFTCDDALCSTGVFVNPLLVNVENSIITGNDNDELLLSDATGGGEPSFFRFNINNSIVRVDDLLDNDPFQTFLENCSFCIEDQGFGNVLFVDTGEDDYHLDTLSIATEQAISRPGVLLDLDGLARSSMPDIGCYESVFK